MYSPAAKEVAQQLGLKMGKANLDVFAETLLVLAKENRDVLAVTSDSRGSGKLGPFGQALPDQIVEMGIAEQNLVGLPRAWRRREDRLRGSPRVFLTARALEQIKNDVATRTTR
jgi:transketolase